MKHLLPCRVYRQDRDRQTGATPRRRWMEDDRWWWPRDRRQQQSHACTASNGIKGRGAAESKRKEHGPGPGQGRPAPAGHACMIRFLFDWWPPCPQRPLIPSSARPSSVAAPIDHRPPCPAACSQPAMAAARARMTSMVRRRVLLAIEAAGRRGGQPPRTLAAGHVADFGDDESDATPTRLPCPPH